MEELDEEISHDVYHFHPEAYEKEEWSSVLQEAKVTPEELKDMAILISKI